MVGSHVMFAEAKISAEPLADIEAADRNMAHLHLPSSARADSGREFTLE